MKKCIKCEGNSKSILCSKCKKDLMKKGRCVECNNGTDNLFNILNIYLCNKCKNNNEKYKTITKTRSKSEYNLNEKDLSILPFTKVDNPHYKCAAPMTLFLKTHVENLSKIKKEINKIGKNCKESF